MPDSVRFALIALSVCFVGVGVFYRIRSQRSGERLDRRKEGWPILIGVRLTGLLIIACTIAWLTNPALFGWASWPIPEVVRWAGVAGFALTVFWLIWIFHTLGRNLTDTVVTRRDAYLVASGPYRLVRNPMYVGVLTLGLALGLALGTWLLPVASLLIFTLFVIRTRTEEHYLIERFGDQYRDYMARVGRFFPKWT